MKKQISQKQEKTPKIHLLISFTENKMVNQVKKKLDEPFYSQSKLKSCYFKVSSLRQVADLLEHTFLQDLSRYEDWSADQVPCHQATSQLPALTDR